MDALQRFIKRNIKRAIGKREKDKRANILKKSLDIPRGGILY